ncbi:MAG: hypothetical protein AB1656_16040 [Candidatus Omnitrophota bacterium]
MKRILCIVIAGLFAIGAYAQTPAYSYLSEFTTQGEPLAIAADANGGVYYTVFTFSGTNLTRCYYIADPLNANGLDNQLLAADGAETDVPAGRGFTGVAVDGKGNVYLALESGAAATATVRKLSPAPEFKPVPAFFDGIVYGNKRYNGVELLTDDTLALSTFNMVEFWDANDATPLYAAVGSESYQRDLAYDPETNNIYLAKNGNNLGNSANLLAGGSPAALEGYASFQNAFIAQGGLNSQYGTNTQLIEYDVYNKLIVIPDYAETQRKMAFYKPSDPSKPVFTLDASESPNGPFAEPTDAVAVKKTSGEVILYITDHSAKRILIYTTGTTKVAGWEIY